MTGQASAGLPSGYPSASVARRALLALALVACVTSSDATMMAVLIEPMKRQMGLSDVQIGLVQGTAFGLAYGIAALPMGRFIDVGRRTRMLVVGILAWGFALAANGLAPNLGVLLVSRAVLGVVSALLIPAAVSLLGDLYPPERRSIATSIFVVGQSCGGGLGILCSGMAFNVLQTMSVRHGWNAELLAPWRVLFYLAAFSAFLLTPLLLLMREPARQERSIERPSLLETLSRLLESRDFLIPLFIGLLFGNVALQASNTWSAPLLMRRFHLTPGDFSGWLSVVTVATGIAGALAGGLAAERGRRWAGRRGVLVPALVSAIIVAPLNLFAIAPNLLSFGFLLGLMMFFSSVIPTVGVLSLTLNLPNESRGLAVGLYAVVSAVFGVAIMPPLIAVVAAHLGGEQHLASAVVIISVPSALLAAFFFLLAMRAKADTDSIL